MRKNDERYPRPERGSGENISQNNLVEVSANEIDFLFSALELIGTVPFFLDLFGDQVNEYLGLLYKCQLISDYVGGSDEDNPSFAINSSKEFFQSYNMDLFEILQGSVPNSNEFETFRKFQKELEHLECCFVSSSELAHRDSKVARLEVESSLLKDKLSKLGFNSGSFKLIEFYKKIAVIKEEDLESSCKKGFYATNEVLTTFRRLFRNSQRVARAVGIEANKISDAIDNDITSEYSTRFLRLFPRLKALYLRCFSDLNCVANTHWDYIPFDLQQLLESIAKQIFLNDCLQEEANSELLRVVKDFVIVIFKVSEDSKFNPKFKLSDLFLNLHNVDASVSSSIGYITILDLTQQLAKFPYVKQVTALANIPEDLHDIVFEVVLSEAFFEVESHDEDSLWEEMERLALRSHRQLRNTTGEKWYFHTELLTVSNSYSRGNAYAQVVTSAHGESPNPS